MLNKNFFSMLCKPVREAIRERGFDEPTEPQEKAGPLILEGKNVLLLAPTGTGKTEAAFLPILHRLYLERENKKGISLLYITPLRSLNRDLLDRLIWWCRKLDIRLAVRHGDTEIGERGKQAKVPPEILITTPETLQAMLTGKILRRNLSHLRWVVVDEVHELATDKRGSQLSIALERLRLLAQNDFQVIGLSATVGNPEEVGKFLVGTNRSIEIVKVPIARRIELKVLYPKPGKKDEELSIKLITYPEVAARLRIIRREIENNTSTLVFTNTRSEAEILASRFRVWDQEFPVGIHHGSLSKPTRVSTEKELKDGKLKGIICTSSLEMGIDIGLLNLIIQYNSPRQVTRLVQRVGRSGHWIGGIARGKIITIDADDMLEACVIAKRALKEDIEPALIPQKPLDALCHQIAGFLIQSSRWSIDEVLRIIRRAYPYRNLSKEELIWVLKYMHDRYPRLAWLSEESNMFAKPASHAELYRYYFENLSMIPEVKQYLVIDENNNPVGLLDEAFIAEYGEIGTKFVEAGKVWRIVDIFEDKVYVESENDPIGALPTWVGEEIPVPFEIAQEVGKIRGKVERELRGGKSIKEIAKIFEKELPASKDELERAFYEIEEQFRLNLPIPSDKRVTIEEWEDLVIVHACFGHLVNRTIGRVLAYKLSEETGRTIMVQQDPYRIVLRCPTLTLNKVREALVKLYDEFDNLAKDAVTRSGMFKRRLIHVARKFGVISKEASFSSIELEGFAQAVKDTPVFEEAYRTTCLNDLDLSKTKEVLKMIKDGKIEVIVVSKQVLTPIAKIGLEEMRRKMDIIPPERLKKIIIESIKARILAEGKIVVCVNCWKGIDAEKVRDLIDGWECFYCGSKRFGVCDESEEKVMILAEKVRAHGLSTPKQYKRMLRRILKSSELIQKYGFPAVFVLSARGIAISDAKSILSKNSNFNEKLVEQVIEREREVMKRRFSRFR
jgi:ATP-dependent Lhr-like helicase